MQEDLVPVEEDLLAADAFDPFRDQLDYIWKVPIEVVWKDLTYLFPIGMWRGLISADLN